MDAQRIEKLRLVINENLRVQRGGAEPVPYIDVSNALSDIKARQNHAVFGRRGCGKTLLLHYSAKTLPKGIRRIYLNCEDFKRHSFPNVLLEILDTLFIGLDKHLGGWFGTGKKYRRLVAGIRGTLGALRQQDDQRQEEVREAKAAGGEDSLRAGVSVGNGTFGLKLDDSLSKRWNNETERKYTLCQDKIRDLDRALPDIKKVVTQLFELSPQVNAVFLEIDDFYHLPRADQPLVMDYVHRLCKDVPLYFKVATLRHASTLYGDRHGQPIGTQEGHDYQPINVDFTFSDFRKTVEQNSKILHEFGRLAGLERAEIDGLFKGEGFARLVLAGGGVPRDCLSLLLKVLEAVQPPAGDGKIGKDDVRILSRANFERRIEELKQDSEGKEQGILIKGIYVLRKFCITKGTNVILVSEAILQQNDKIRDLMNRILDYRIIHTAGSALTHKSLPGTYHAFVIDIGCYAHMRVLQGKLDEIDLSDPSAKEKMRSAAVLDEAEFASLWEGAPSDAEAALAEQDSA